MHKPVNVREPKSKSAYLDRLEVHREYEAMMERPLPVWMTRAGFLILGLILGGVTARMFL